MTTMTEIVDQFFEHVPDIESRSKARWGAVLANILFEKVDQKQDEVLPSLAYFLSIYFNPITDQFFEDIPDFENRSEARWGVSFISQFPIYFL